MPCRLILGRAGSGKSHYCLQQIAQRIKEAPRGHKLVLLVPEQATFITERALAQDFGLGAYTRAEVTSFSRLVFLAQQSCGGREAVLSAAAKQMAVLTIAKARKDSLKALSRAVDRPDFAADIVGQLDEFAAYGADIAALPKSYNRHLDDKLADLRLIGADLADFCRGRYQDPAFDPYYLARCIDGGFLSDAEVFIDGFSAFTPAEFAVVKALSKQAKGLYIALNLPAEALKTPPRPGGIFYPLYRQAQRLLCLTDEPPLVLPADAAVLPPRFAASPALAFLEQSLYSGSRTPFTGEQNSIFLRHAADRREEVRLVASSIVELVRRHGYRYRDISVVCRDIAPYQNLLAEVFAAYDIPCFLDRKQPVYFHPRLEALRAALELATDGPSYRALFRYIKSGGAGVGFDDAAALEDYLLAAGNVAARFKQQGDWRYWPHSLGPCDNMLLDKLNSLRRRLLVDLEGFLNLPVRPSLGDLCRVVNDWAAATGLWQAMDDEAAAAIAAGRGGEASACRQTVDYLAQLLDDTQRFLADMQLDKAAACDVLDKGVASGALALIPHGLDQVLVGAIERSRNPAVRACFVLGLNEGVFPARAQQSGLLNAAERSLLNQCGLDLAAGARERQLAEAYLLYVALTRSSQRLYLSYLRGSDDEGEALAPSRVLDRLRRLFPSLADEAAADLIKGCLSRGVSLTDIALKARGGLDQQLTQAFDWYKQAPGFADRFAMLQKGLFFAPLPPLPLLRPSEGLTSSITALSRFAACPRLYFAADTLRLKQRPLGQPDAATTGSLLHTALEQLSRAEAAGDFSWRSVGENRLTELSRQKIDALSRDFYDDLYFSSPRYDYLRRRLQGLLFNQLCVIARHCKSGGFVPQAFELRFGAGGQLRSPDIALPGGGRLRLNGLIDRVDLAKVDGRAYLRVIDYKTGKNEIKFNDILNDNKLQLPFYLQVALQNSSYFSDLPTLGAGYYYALVRDDPQSLPQPPEQTPDALFNLQLCGVSLADEESVALSGGNAATDLLQIVRKSDGSFSSRANLMTASQAKQLPQLLDEQLSRLGEGVLTGDIAARPSGQKDPCKYCNYRSFCGLEGELARRKRKTILDDEGGDTDD